MHPVTNLNIYVYLQTRKMGSYKSVLNTIKSQIKNSLENSYAIWGIILPPTYLLNSLIDQKCTQNSLFIGRQFFYYRYLKCRMPVILR